MGRAGGSDISESERLAEAARDAVFAVVPVDVGEDDIVVLVVCEETVERVGDIIDIAGMPGFSDEAEESLAASEADGALSRDAAREESYMHGIIDYQPKGTLSERS